MRHKREMYKTQTARLGLQYTFAELCADAIRGVRKAFDSALTREEGMTEPGAAQFDQEHNLSESQITDKIHQALETGNRTSLVMWSIILYNRKRGGE